VQTAVPKDFDKILINNDLNNYNKIRTSNKYYNQNEILKQLIIQKQEVMKDVISVECIRGFDTYENFKQLNLIANSGV
jgi:hypothetical protein